MTGARILVIKQEGLQSFVEAEPAFEAVRAANPGIPIDLLTTPNLGRLAKGAPYFDRVLAAEPVTTKTALKAFTAQLKRIGYEQIYDFDGSRATLDLRSAMTGLRGPRWIGPRRPVTRSSRYGAPSMSAYDMKRMLRDARVAMAPRLPDLHWALEGRKDAANMRPTWFGISGQFALFLPAVAEGRRWPIGHYAEVARRLSREGISTVILGNEQMGSFAQAVSEAVGDSAAIADARPVVDLTGKADLPQVAMLGRHAAFFVGGASEEMHLCLSVGCPGVVVLHSSDREEADAVFGRDVIKLNAKDLSEITPEMAMTMLKNMGAIGRQQRAQAVAKSALA